MGTRGGGSGGAHGTELLLGALAVGAVEAHPALPEEHLRAWGEGGQGGDSGGGGSAGVGVAGGEGLNAYQLRIGTEIKEWADHASLLSTYAPPPHIGHSPSRWPRPRLFA